MREGSVRSVCVDEHMRMWLWVCCGCDLCVGPYESQSFVAYIAPRMFLWVSEHVIRRARYAGCVMCA